MKNDSNHFIQRPGEVHNIADVITGEQLDNWNHIHTMNSLFRKKRFEINFFVQQNASKFAIFIEKENPRSFFRFSFRAFLSFTL